MKEYEQIIIHILDDLLSNPSQAIVNTVSWLYSPLEERFRPAVHYSRLFSLPFLQYFSDMINSLVLYEKNVNVSSLIASWLTPSAVIVIHTLTISI